MIDRPRQSRIAVPRAANGGRPRDRKPWTVLVWIAGDNDLDQYGIADINELKQVGSGEASNIVVQFDRMGDGLTRRYHLQPGTRLELDEVATLPETNTGDPATAIDFFTWGIKSYPSERVLAVIWNHGSGIDETDVYALAAARGVDVRRKAPAKQKAVPHSQVRAITSSGLRRALFSSTIDAAISSKAIAYDDTSRDFLDNAELRHVLAEVARRTGRNIDVLGFDACLMNMIEVVYELRGLVDYVVGSEETEPGEGWPYERVMADVVKSPPPASRKLATSIVKRYLGSYTAASNVTQSALDASQITEAVAATDEVAGAVIGALRTDDDFLAFRRALRTAQRFKKGDFVDLGDLAARLEAELPTEPVRTATQRLHRALSGENGLVVATGHKGKDVPRATGVAIYFPFALDVQVAYDQLAFARDTRWTELIRKYQEW